MLIFKAYMPILKAYMPMPTELSSLTMSLYCIVYRQSAQFATPMAYSLTQCTLQEVHQQIKLQRE